MPVCIEKKMEICSGVTIAARQTATNKERWSYSANGPLVAEMSKKSHRKNAEEKGRFFGGIEYLVQYTENRKPKDPFLVREGKNLLRVSHKNLLLQDAGHCFMLH